MVCPYILEDMTGRLTGGSEFVDIHDRLRLAVHCTTRDASHTGYMIFDTTPSAFQPMIPRTLAALDFGQDNSLGTVTFAGVGVPMRQYLTRPNAMGRQVCFRARISTQRSDGSSRRTGRRISGHDAPSPIRSGQHVPSPPPDPQPCQTYLSFPAQCTNTNGYVLASYSLKAPGEPEYPGSSGCILEITEQFGSLAPDNLPNDTYIAFLHPHLLVHLA
ncbi:hypothetical protein FB451DRAFT_1478681 [Mycena latifolia]|nr:hypothetical protein FB451DRAFT_1478681 [Mycena latifolia]